MIYIKSINTAFIKIPKTASSSLSLFFLRNIPEDDILSTQIDQDHILVPEYLTKRFKPRFKDDDYTSASMDVQHIISKGILPRDTKFIGVIRNPITRCLSAFLSDCQREQKSLDFLTQLNTPSNDYKPQYKFLEYNQEIIGTWWCYDFITQHVDKFMHDNQFEVKFPFPHINQTVEGTTSEQLIGRLPERFKEMIERRYKEDLEIYNKVKGLGMT